MRTLGPRLQLLVIPIARILGSGEISVGTKNSAHKSIAFVRIYVELLAAPGQQTQLEGSAFRRPDTDRPELLVGDTH